MFRYRDETLFLAIGILPTNYPELCFVFSFLDRSGHYVVTKDVDVNSIFEGIDMSMFENRNSKRWRLWEEEYSHLTSSLRNRNKWIKVDVGKPDRHVISYHQAQFYLRPRLLLKMGLTLCSHESNYLKGAYHLSELAGLAGQFVNSMLLLAVQTDQFVDIIIIVLRSKWRMGQKQDSSMCCGLKQASQLPLQFRFSSFNSDFTVLLLVDLGRPRFRLP